MAEWLEQGGGGPRRKPAPCAALVLACAAVFIACGGGDAREDSPGDEPAPGSTPAGSTHTSVEPTGPGGADPEVPKAADPYADYPLHGLVTGTQLTVRQDPDPDSLVLGWLRRGEQLRLKPSEHRTSTCASGWHAIHPRGYACAGVGIDVRETPHDVSPQMASGAARDQALPYPYYFVKDPHTPEYLQLPSRSLQRAAADYVARWRELAADEKHARRLERFLKGEQKDEPSSPVGVRRFLDRGFFVAGTGLETRASRVFVRTVSGTYVQQAQMIERAAPAFSGVALGEDVTLPVAWAVRSAHPLERLDKWDGSIKYREKEGAEVIERLTRLTQWKARTRVGDRYMHLLDDGTYLHDWFVAVAEPVDPPRGVKGDAPWVHVDLSSQTLVLYRGAEPVFATLVSTGLPDHATPAGEYAVARKHVSDTMADIGADGESDRYRIEDVPWTQYFSGSLALHGAFWHDRFGMPRSHGCVNLSPVDAQRVFDHTRPTVPVGWHGVSVFKTGVATSKVLITE